MIDKKSPIPVYFQLKNYIKNDIEERKLVPGDLILSESKYCEMFGISRMTVRQALNQLEVEGIIVRERGKGSFVAIPRIEQEGLMSFTQMVKSKGMEPSTEIIEFEKIIDDKISNILKVQNEEIYVIERVRKADDFPVAVETIYIPVKFVPKLESRNLKGSFYEILKEQYNIEIKSSNTSFSAVTCDKKLKNMLQLDSIIPLLKLQSINYYVEPIYYEISYYRSDQFNITVNLNKI